MSTLAASAHAATPQNPEPATTGTVVVHQPTKVKVRVPDLFTGEPPKTRGFIAQLKLYFRFNQEQFPDNRTKVTFAASYMRGKAEEWFSGYLEDYLENGLTGDTRADTRNIFKNFESFENELRKVFAEVDREREAERRLVALKQLTSAAAYTASFNELSMIVQWNEAALCAQYYRGLKEAIKDEISKDERETTVAGLSEDAIRIDHRMMERRQERYGNYSMEYKRKDKPKFNPWTDRTRATSFPEPMEVGTLKKEKGNPYKTEKQRRFKEGLCLACGKAGHRIKDCNQNKKKGKGKPMRMNMIRYDGTSNEESWENNDTWQHGETEDAESTLCEEGTEYHTPNEVVREEGTLLDPTPGVTRFIDAMNEYYDARQALHDGPRTTHLADTPYGRHSRESSRFCYHHNCPAHGEDSHDGLPPGRNAKCLMGTTHWWQCDKYECQKHWAQKIVGKLYPTTEHILARCDAAAWVDCTRDWCKKHLYEKRMNHVFPKEEGDMHTERGATGGRCTGGLWQLCMNPVCETHEPDKLIAGYMPQTINPPKNF
jgi:hypothetical protein